ncbi:MAG TPA: hypothetical protein VF771_04865 [Longimicrobiaceae bacterium]
MKRFPVLSMLAAVVLLAGCSDGTGPDTDGHADVTIVTASGTQKYSLDAGFYPYSPGPTAHDRAVYFVVGTGPTSPGLEFSFFQSLAADQELPVPGTFQAGMVAAGTAMTTSVYYTEHPELGHVIAAGSTITIETVSATRVTGHFDLILQNAQFKQVATVHATFSAPRAATYQDLPQLGPGASN